MPDGTQLYTRKVINRDGVAIFLPRVKDMDSLVQGDFDPYAQSSTKLFPVGTVAKEARDEWTYSKAGVTALDIAAPSQSAAAVHAEQDDDIDVDVTVAQAIGSYDVYLTSTSNLDDSPNNVADDFVDGYLIVNDSTGQGQMYKIKANEAFSGTSVIKFTLYRPLTIALDTNSQVGLIRNPAYKTIVAAAPITGRFAGVPLIPVTAAYYYWAKTKGEAPVLCHATLAIGTVAVIGVQSGQDDPISALTAQCPIGMPMTPGVAGDYHIVDLW